jgi:hypothetical protein
LSCLPATRLGNVADNSTARDDVSSEPPAASENSESSGARDP